MSESHDSEHEEVDQVEDVDYDESNVESPQNNDQTDDPVRHDHRGTVVVNGICPNVLFVSRFARGTTKKDVEELMSQYGPTSAITVRETLAFVDFVNADDAKVAKESCHYHPGLGSDSLIVDFKKDKDSNPKPRRPRSDGPPPRRDSYQEGRGRDRSRSRERPPYDAPRHEYRDSRPSYRYDSGPNYPPMSMRDDRPMPMRDDRPMPMRDMRDDRPMPMRDDRPRMPPPRDMYPLPSRRGPPPPFDDRGRNMPPPPLNGGSYDRFDRDRGMRVPPPFDRAMDRGMGRMGPPPMGPPPSYDDRRGMIRRDSRDRSREPPRRFERGPPPPNPNFPPQSRQFYDPLPLPARGGGGPPGGGDRFRGDFYPPDDRFPPKKSF